MDGIAVVRLHPIITTDIRDIGQPATTRIFGLRDTFYHVYDVTTLKSVTCNSRLSICIASDLQYLSY